MPKLHCNVAKGAVQEDQPYLFDAVMPGGVKFGLLNDGEFSVVMQAEVGYGEGHPDGNMEGRARGVVRGEHRPVADM